MSHEYTYWLHEVMNMLIALASGGTQSINTTMGGVSACVHHTSVNTQMGCAWMHVYTYTPRQGDSMRACAHNTHHWQIHE